MLSKPTPTRRHQPVYAILTQRAGDYDGHYSGLSNEAGELVGEFPQVRSALPGSLLP